MRQIWSNCSKAMTLSTYITAAIKYWEPRRLVYNFVMALIVLYYAAPVALQERGFSWIPGILALFVLAVMANILYCAAYPVDIFIQMSDFKEIWMKFRWLLFLLGLALASIFTWFLCQGIFLPFSGR